MSTNWFNSLFGRNTVTRRYVDPAKLLGKSDPNGKFYEPGADILQRVHDSGTTTDLRPQDVAIYDQGQEGSCTANGSGGFLGFILKKLFGVNFMPSRAFIYYEARKRDGDVHEDSGSSVAAAMAVINEEGACPDSEMPYSDSDYTTAPNAAQKASAKQHRTVDAVQVKQDEAHLRACIAEGFPFVFGFNVPASFEGASVARTGVMPMPRRGERVIGGHCVEGVGFTDSNGKARFAKTSDAAAFAVGQFVRKVSHALRSATGASVFAVNVPANCVICRNSWGTGWGDKGYFYMPVPFITDSKWCSDFWTARHAVNGGSQK